MNPHTLAFNASSDFGLNNPHRVPIIQTQSNTCFNKLRLDPEGDLRQLLEPFLTKSDETEDLVLDFNKIIPEQTSTKEESRAWRLKNWGTSKNPTTTTLSKTGVTFHTAYTPPIGIVRQLAAHTGKNFKLYYQEKELELCGEITIPSDGKIQTIQYPIGSAPLELIEELGSYQDTNISI